MTGEGSSRQARPQWPPAGMRRGLLKVPNMLKMASSDASVEFCCVQLVNQRSACDHRNFYNAALRLHLYAPNQIHSLVGLALSSLIETAGMMPCHFGFVCWPVLLRPSSRSNFTNNRFIVTFDEYGGREMEKRRRYLRKAFVSTVGKVLHYRKGDVY